MSEIEAFENKELFENVLEKDEEIICIKKPNKTKYFWSFGIASFFIALICALSILGIAFETPYWWIVLAVSLFAFVLSILLFGLYYKNYFFCLTNKKIIVRSGIFGIDYKTLQLDTVGAINVTVTLLDKMVCKNTGTLVFGSMSSPMFNGANGSGGGYRFAHVEKPYELFKLVKSTKENVLAEKAEEK